MIQSILTPEKAVEILEQGCFADKATSDAVLTAIDHLNRAPLLNELVDKLLEDRITMYGVENTIQYIWDYTGADTKALVELGFDEDDIIDAVTQDDTLQ